MNANKEGMNTIEAFPAKRFFVDMLTRDIELLDAVLDLIDNSLDAPGVRIVVA